MELKKYYFTFGSDKSFPFRGGWVEVYAKDIRHAAKVFRKKYPDREDYGCLNCADYYSEENFTMLESGNMGEFCHEVLMPYMNEDSKCECHKCELTDCAVREKYQRLPRTANGALGLCQKL